MGMRNNGTSKRLKDLWQNQNIQTMQDAYANLTQMSIWVLDLDGNVISKRSLTADFEEEQLGEVDALVSKVDVQADYEEFEYRGDLLLLKKKLLCVEGRELGYSVFTKIVLKHVEKEKKEFSAWADFFQEVLVNVMFKDSQIWNLNQRLQKAQEEEKSMEKEKARLQHENDYDELTQVHSRSYFYKCLEEVEQQEEMLPVSVIVGDVNNLKFTNDMFGHRHGDWLLYKVAQVLKEEAEILEKEIGNRIVVSRCGGDEFSILMTRTKRSGANYYCHRVTEHLKREYDCCLPPSISLGCAKKSEMSQSLYRVLETADAKMYAAKREFKQKLDHFEEMMNILFTRRFLSESAVDRKESMMEKFGEYLSWKPETIQNCMNLIRYQDIGLTVVPEKVFRKNGNYTELEWREIKKHPQLGMKLALIRPDLAPISDMMYLTHENYDGSGWPQGVAGERIVPEVMAVRLVTEYVDYEEDHTHSGACEYIRSESGRIFEPEMAEKFIRFLNIK